MLGSLNDGHAIAATAYAALVRAQDTCCDEPPDLGEIAITLDHGLALLRRAIDEVDVAFGKLT